MAVRTLPMFPLGNVLLPREPLPLHVFEPRYRIMMRELLQGDGEFGVVLIERGHEVGGGESRFDVGCLARVAQSEELPDGRFALLAVGLDPIEVVEWLADDPYPRAEVRVREPVPVDPAAVATAGVTLRAHLEELVTLVQVARPDAVVPPFELPGDDADALWTLAAVLGLGPLDRMRLLAGADDLERAALLVDALEERILIARAHIAEQ